MRKNNNYVDKPKSVKSDGRFSVGQEIAFGVGEGKFINSRILKIMRKGRKNEFEYQIGHIDWHRKEVYDKTWTTIKNIREMNGFLVCMVRNSKYKKDDIVYPSCGYLRHNKCKIVEAYSNKKYLNIIYKISKVDADVNMNEFLRMDDISEENLRNDQISVNESKKFKVGDPVKIIAWWNKKNERSDILKIISYEVEPDVYYYETGGAISGVFNEDEIKMMRPPVIIFSDSDPYGEEDWGEDDD